MPFFPPPTVIREHTLDAIVVVPGIMGSALKDAERGTIWGFRNPKTYVQFWGPGAAMTPLAFTSAELEAISEQTYDPKTARVQPDGLIKFSAFAPLTGGFEPYTRLVRALQDAAAHPAAVLEFSYDWRLPTRLNSHLLAQKMEDHLSQWRQHEAHAAARQIHPEQRDAGIIIVAHSMGGLVARGLADNTIEDGFKNVRQVITLGTPFLGSVRAAVMLANGEGIGVPLPRERLRDVARTMPGLYELLPRNRCVLTNHDGTEDVRALTVDDVANIGGCRQLAEAASRDFGAMKGTSMPGHRPVVGVAQPTWQSLQIRAGVVDPAYFSYRWDRQDELLRDDIGRPRPYQDQGDGTVWRYAACPPGSLAAAEPVAQQHGALASSGDSIKKVIATITNQGDLGVRLGGEIGLDVPDTTLIESPLTVIVTGEADPSRVECRVVDLGRDQLVRRPRLRSDGHGGLQDSLSLPDDGLYRVEVTRQPHGKSETGDWVTRIFMVTRPEP